jgi:hypothetical protein
MIFEQYELLDIIVSFIWGGISFLLILYLCRGDKVFFD